MLGVPLPKNLVGEPFSVSLFLGVEKFYRSECYVTVFCRFFLSHSAEKNRRGTLLCCVSENIRKPRSSWIRAEGVSRFSVEEFLSQSAEKFRRGTVRCVTILAYRKKFCFRRLCHDFLSNSFVSQCRKTP